VPTNGRPTDLVGLAWTALPLIVAITEIGLQTHRMKPENAAALVGAGMLSVLLFPSTAFALRRRNRAIPDVIARPVTE
jgi:hypothetical protein